MLKKDIAMQQSKERLQKDLQRSTRQKIDPFLLDTFDPARREDGTEVGVWLKRKRPKVRVGPVVEEEVTTTTVESDGTSISGRQAKDGALALVGYDSDSDS
ncbi:hypothetical protein ABW21_db0209218 [Orbilia brochopaga]|nr:hypothetical protein ABW21_db0209218 [Drechslerella brochopaga]